MMAAPACAPCSIATSCCCRARICSMWTAASATLSGEVFSSISSASRHVRVVHSVPHDRHLRVMPEPFGFALGILLNLIGLKLLDARYQIVPQLFLRILLVLLRGGAVFSATPRRHRLPGRG